MNGKVFLQKKRTENSRNEEEKTTEKKMIFLLSITQRVEISGTQNEHLEILKLTGHIERKTGKRKQRVIYRTSLCMDK